jgi:hypothetical protein
MKKENYFSKKLKNKSNSELRQYIENKRQYQKEAVQAAIWELESRGEKNEEASKIEEEIQKESETKERSLSSYLGIPVHTVKPGIRFVHFLIDGFIIQAFIYAINIIPSVEVAQFFGILLYPFYYIFCEYHYQFTPGKLISNTIVINENGERPELRTIILRTFARYVPFEPFSCLGDDSWGWHDRWTKTYVIDKKDISTLREKKGLPPIELTPLKLSKNAYILIGAFIAMLVISSVVTKNMNSQLAQEGQEWIESLDEKDQRNIMGSWITSDSDLEHLNFVSKESVISTSSDSTTKNLNYKIENRVLTIFGSGFSKEFVLIESSSGRIQLIDAQNPMEKIIWTKK